MTAMKSRVGLLAPIGFFAVAALIGVTSSNHYVLQQGTILWCYALAVVGLSFAIHVSGEFLLGQGAIFALSGYIGAITTTHWHEPYVVGLLVGLAGGGVLGLIIGLGALRTSGWYFAMASFFLAAIVPEIIDYFPSLTGAETGLFGVPVASFAGQALSARGLYLLVLGCVLVSAVLIGVLRATRAGLAMAVMRERPAAAASLGYSPVRLRLIVFVVCSLPAGLGGAFYAHLYGFVQPTLFPLNQTILFFSAVVIGGRRLTGSLVGITVLFLLPIEALGAGANNDIIYSATVIVVAIVIAQRSSVSTRLMRRIPDRLRNVAVLLGSGPIVEPTAVDVSPDGARAAARLLQSGASGPRDSLIARQVRVSFGSFTAVSFAQDDELEVPAGRVPALLGANGSGKTTLLNAISGHVRSRGSIEVAGRPFDQLSATARAKAGLGRSWQSPALPNELTPLQLVSLGLASRTEVGNTRRRRLRDVETIALEALDLAGLGDQARSRVAVLSSAQRRWLDLLVSVSRPVTVAILDEPGAGLTRAGRAALAELVSELSDTGVAVVLIEHDLDLALRVADVVTVLDVGAPIYQGDPDGVRSDPNVRTLFLGEGLSESQAPDDAVPIRTSP
jgi:ABC-type branched-subunit amino acid transport system ATPase component/ABC-type branched-subunit amino acid transport system permease subunit